MIIFPLDLDVDPRRKLLGLSLYKTRNNRLEIGWRKMSNERLITQVPPRGSPWKTQVKAFIMSEKGGKGERQRVAMEWGGWRVEKEGVGASDG